MILIELMKLLMIWMDYDDYDDRCEEEKKSENVCGIFEPLAP